MLDDEESQTNVTITKSRRRFCGAGLLAPVCFSDFDMKNPFWGRGLQYGTSLSGYFYATGIDASAQNGRGWEAGLEKLQFIAIIASERIANTR